MATLPKRRGFRVALLSAGSRGDVQPMVLLGRQLQAKGHTVQALVNFASVRFCIEMGVEARAVYVDFQELVTRLGGQGAEGLAHGDKMDRAVVAWMKDNPGAMAEPIDAIRKFKPDVVVWNCDGGPPSAYEVKFGVPAVEVQCYGAEARSFMSKTPSRPSFVTVSPLLVGKQELVMVERAGCAEHNGRYVRSSPRTFEHENSSGSMCWYVAKHRLWFIGNPEKYGSKATYFVAGDVDRLPEEGWRTADDQQGREPMPVVKYCHIQASTPTLPPHAYQTGAWLPRGDVRPSELAELELSASVTKDLSAFIEGGSAPVAIGWGSMLAKDMSPSSMLILALRALRICGRRAVIVGGWAKLQDALGESWGKSGDGGARGQGGAKEVASASELAELAEFAARNCFLVASVQHHWLFPRCSCAVHHGGAGTTQAALHAGRPVVITPVAYDQPQMSRAVRDLGVGVGFEKLLPLVSSDELADAIVRAEAMALAAEELGRRLEAEGGVAEAAGVLDAFLQEAVGPGKWRSEWSEVWRRRCEEARTTHEAQQASIAKQFDRLRSGERVGQTWIVENSRGERFVHHNASDGSFISYKEGTSQVVRQGRWTMQDRNYAEQTEFPVTGTLLGNCDLGFWMSVDVGPHGGHRYTPAPAPYVEGHAVR